jgi:hypothetical protein
LIGDAIGPSSHKKGLHRRQGHDNYRRFEYRQLTPAPANVKDSIRSVPLFQVALRNEWEVSQLLLYAGYPVSRFVRNGFGVAVLRALDEFASALRSRGPPQIGGTWSDAVVVRTEAGWSWV